MKKLVAPLKATVKIVCPVCGEEIEVKIAGVSCYDTEETEPLQKDKG